jgi:nitrogen fixation NifU-like protein
VVDAAFEGRGCAISQASASMMMEEIIGMPVDELKRWGKEDVLELLGIEIGPVRLKCALLPLKALKAGLYGLTDWPE